MARQVLVNPKDIHHHSATVRGREARHLIRVLRVSCGDTLSLFDGRGGTYQGTVESVGTSEVEVSLREGLNAAPRKIEPPDPLKLTVVQAVPKQKGMETVVSQCTQVGVDRFVPILTERTQVRLDLEEPGHKWDRWERVIQETAKQCGTAHLPTLEKPVTFSDYLRRLEPFDLSLIGALEGQRHPLEKVLQLYKDSKKTLAVPMSVCLLIGPEGDFTASELKEAVQHDFQVVSLGAQVLRADTAATVFTALVRYELSKTTH